MRTVQKLRTAAGIGGANVRPFPLAAACLCLVALGGVAITGCGGSGSTSTTYPYSGHLVGVWRGETAGLRITAQLNPATCDFGCGGDVVGGGFNYAPTADTGSFIVAVGAGSYVFNPTSGATTCTPGCSMSITFFANDTAHFVTEIAFTGTLLGDTAMKLAGSPMGPTDTLILRKH